MLFIQIRVYSRLHPVTAPLLLSVPGTGLLVHLIRLYSFFFFRHLFHLRSAFFKISVVVCPSTHLNFRMYAFVSFCVFVSKQFLSNRAKTKYSNYLNQAHNPKRTHLAVCENATSSGSCVCFLYVLQQLLLLHMIRQQEQSPPIFISSNLETFCLEYDRIEWK